MNPLRNQLLKPTVVELKVVLAPLQALLLEEDPELLLSKTIQDPKPAADPVPQTLDTQLETTFSELPPSPRLNNNKNPQIKPLP
jgi:hypothetical protein